MSKKTPTCYAISESENITACTVDEAVVEWLEWFEADRGDEDILPDTLTVQGYAKQEISRRDFDCLLANAVEMLDEKCGPQDYPSDYELSGTAREKWNVFVDQVIAEYPVYTVEECGEPIVVKTADYMRGK